MYNFEINKSKKDKILENVNFTKRERKIFELLTEDVSRKELTKYLNCSPRTIYYDIKKISVKIEEYENDKQIINYSVYIHIFPNGKKYVGVSENINKRWGTFGLPYVKNIEMYKDILKYGWENIKHEIILVTNDSFKARKLENKIIEIFELTNDKNGYNKKT